jgi:hypothetical protein
MVVIREADTKRPVSTYAMKARFSYVQGLVADA